MQYIVPQLMLSSVGGSVCDHIPSFTFSLSGCHSNEVSLMSVKEEGKEPRAT